MNGLGAGQGRCEFLTNASRRKRWSWEKGAVRDLWEKV
jgi:hypothetical protein